MAAEVVFTPAQFTSHNELPANRPATGTAVALSVVVVNFRRPDQTAALARQLDTSDSLRSSQAEIVIVDNDADPRPLRQTMGTRASVVIRSFGRNRGFARAVNEACRASRGQWLLLLNPDVRVPEEFLDKVISFADRAAAHDPRIGAVGFQLRNADHSPQPSAGPFPTILNVLTGLARPRSRRRCRPFDTGIGGPVDWVTGCCLLIRRECWLDLGGFDEDYFLYYEDVDFCRRARERQWTIWFEPSLNVIHDHPLHGRRITPVLRVVTRHALLTYTSKHWPSLQHWFLGRMVRIEASLRSLWGVLGGDPDAVKRYRRLAQLTKDLMRGRATRARYHLLRAADALCTEP